jgi:hypothetical protein
MNRCSLVASPAQSYQHIFKLDSGFPQKESPEPFGGLYPSKKAPPSDAFSYQIFSAGRAAKAALVRRWL